MQYLARLSVGAVLGLLVALSAIVPANANAQHIKTHGPVQAPLGLQIFCLKHPDQCRSSGQARIAMTTSLMKILAQTNTHVNQSIRPRQDRNGDIWSINVHAGDCEDYALTKRAKLIIQGISANALSIATGFTHNGEAHAVLVIRTDKGDFILDNRRSDIRQWHKTNLDWRALSSGNLRKWRKVQA